jgi:coenzyme F420-0:L-glutamate ligase/coenzyme F420-1:gamma-L-glutamate ligase
VAYYVYAGGIVAMTIDISQTTNPERAALDFWDIIRGRRSVRSYHDRPVPRDLVMQVLEAAGWAPSPHGRMPWRFVVLTDAQTKVRLSQAMAREWQRQLEMDGQPPEVVATRLHKSQTRLVRAPVLIMPCLYLLDLDQYPDPQRQAAEKTMALQSLGAAVQNMLLAAYYLGLDSGWMCAPLFCPEVVVETLALDAALIPQALITLGYMDQPPKRRSRLPLADLVVQWE